MERKAAPACPKCAAAETIPIMYGYPNYEAFLEQEAGLIKLGGCLIDPSDPNWYCKKCGHAWQQVVAAIRRFERTGTR
ncbi:MAG TPA: hypothetical protein VGA61_14005 [Anaerolineae bacterium]